MQELAARMGTFLVVLGIGVLILFVLSDLAKQPDFDFLFGAVLLLSAGWLLQRRRPAQPASGRFSLLRRRRPAGKTAAPAAPRHDQEEDS
jgi:hypothetical protein